MESTLIRDGYLDMIYYLLLIFTFSLILFLGFRHYKNKYSKLINKRFRSCKGCGYIYFYRGKWELMNLPLVKIGRTNNMHQRMRSAKTSNPYGVNLLAVVRVKDDVKAEHLIHKKFERYRISKRNEWFWFLPVWFFMVCVNDKKLKGKLKKDMSL